MDSPDVPEDRGDLRRYRVVSEATGEVLNEIMWDGISPYDPPEGTRVEPAQNP